MKNVMTIGISLAACAASVSLLVSGCVSRQNGPQKLVYRPEVVIDYKQVKKCPDGEFIYRTDHNTYGIWRSTRINNTFGHWIDVKDPEHYC